VPVVEQRRSHRELRLGAARVSPRECPSHVVVVGRNPFEPEGARRALDRAPQRGSGLLGQIAKMLGVARPGALLRSFGDELLERELPDRLEHLISGFAVWLVVAAEEALRDEPLELICFRVADCRRR